MKKENAILMVSFGTTHLDTLAETITVIEEHARERFPEYQVYRAFTSQVVLDKLKKKADLAFDNVREAMERMAADGIKTVIVQPTHIINGIENDKMMSDLMEYSDRFEKIRVGKPLLSNVSDYKKAIHAIIAEINPAEGEALILMGHGTDHHANSAYPTLEYTFHALGFNRVLVGTVEGFPDLRNVMKKLEIADIKKAILMPFMIVAGDHAKNDMAGEEDSWQSELTANGYEVQVILKGLGQLEGIRNIFMEHLEAVM